jgi:hypothetical protein
MIGIVTNDKPRPVTGRVTVTIVDFTERPGDIPLHGVECSHGHNIFVLISQHHFAVDQLERFFFVSCLLSVHFRTPSNRGLMCSLRNLPGEMASNSPSRYYSGISR